MAAQTFDQLKDEIAKACAVLEPQIRGLDDLYLVSVSAETRAEIKTANDDRKRRYGFLTQVDASLVGLQRSVDNLIADGYPDMPKEGVNAAVYEELQGQKADEAAAHDQFQLEAAADKVTITLGEPGPK
jgi:hypothetical protein